MKFVATIAALRSENGCPVGQKQQTHESLKECLVEETGEVLEAIDKKDDANLCEELGDVLLQVVMHAEIAAEEGRFPMIEDVISGVNEKMIPAATPMFSVIKFLPWKKVWICGNRLNRKKKKQNPANKRFYFTVEK